MNKKLDKISIHFIIPSLSYNSLILSNFLEKFQQFGKVSNYFKFKNFYTSILVPIKDFLSTTFSS